VIYLARNSKKFINNLYRLPKSLFDNNFFILIKEYPVFSIECTCQYAFNDPKEELAYFILKLANLLNDCIDKISIMSFFGIPELLVDNIIDFMLKNQYIKTVEQFYVNDTPFEHLKKFHTTDKYHEPNFYLFSVTNKTLNDTFFEITETGYNFIEEGIKEIEFEEITIFYCIPDLEFFISKKQYIDNYVPRHNYDISNIYSIKIEKLLEQINEHATQKDFDYLKKHGLSDRLRKIKNTNGKAIIVEHKDFIPVILVPIISKNNYVPKLRIGNIDLPYCLEKEKNILSELLKDISQFIKKEVKKRTKLNVCEIKENKEGGEKILEIIIKINRDLLEENLILLKGEFSIDFFDNSTSEENESFFLRLPFKNEWEVIFRIRFLPFSKNEAKILTMLNFIKIVNSKLKKGIMCNLDDCLSKCYYAMSQRVKFSFLKPTYDEIEDFLWSLREYRTLHYLYEWRYINNGNANSK